MNVNIVLPALLFLSSGLAMAIALAGLLMAERAARYPAVMPAAGFARPAHPSATIVAQAARLSPAKASARVAARRRHRFPAPGMLLPVPVRGLSTTAI